MKFIFILLTIFLFVRFSGGQTDNSEFVTLWTPKFAQENAHYRVFLLPSNIDKATEAAVQFRKSYATVSLAEGKLAPIEYKTKQSNFGSGTTLNVTMTLLRNMTGSGSSVQPHCSTKTVPIIPSMGNFYNFIQTDKPIYKPGDKVQFRVLTVDKYLRPFHRNNIDALIIDPFNRIVGNLTDQTDQHTGVFSESFELSTSTVLGDWKIKVIVDKKPNAAVYKKFSVQKYVLPLFEVHVEIDRPDLLTFHDVNIKIYAKYSFDEYVTGNAQLIIRNAATGHVYSSEYIQNIAEPKVITKKIQSYQLIDETKLEAFVEFTEPQSGIKFNKTAVFNVHTDTKFKLTVLHPEKFLPDFPFNVEVYVNDWKNDKVMSHNEQVLITYSHVFQNGSTGSVHVHEVLRNGKIVSEYHVPKQVGAFKIEVKFPNSYSYRMGIPMGSVSIGLNKLEVGHAPKNAKLNDQVKITVKSDLELDDLMVAVITRHGNTETKQISCNGSLTCEFNLKVSKQMMPQSTVMVYSVKNKQHIYQGKTMIETDSLCENYLQLKLSTAQTRPRKNVSMEFRTKPNSKIYVLAFDKRLKFLADGNDFTKEDVVKTVADYDGENKVIVDDLSSWHVCSAEELNRAKLGRIFVSGHSEGTTFGMDVDDDDSEEHTDEEEEEEPITPPAEQGDEEIIRENFPETWIFKELRNKGSDPFTETFTAPDSITTWMISAFSVHNTNGIALAPAQELVVKDEFFIKFNLPYSIRYTEVLRLDILVFNYLTTNEPVDATVTVRNLKGKEFQFVEYNKNNSNCVPTYNNNAESNKVITVPARSIRRASFYIRSDPTNNEFDSKTVKKITIQASGSFKRNGKTQRDTVKKKLTIEPVGIKKYQVFPLSYNLKGETSLPHTEKTAFSEDLVRINVIATGDMLGSVMKLDEMIQLNPDGCLEQRTSKFKRNADIYRYLKLINKNPSRDLLTKQIQMVRDAFSLGYNYKNDGWYRAHLIDALGTASKSGALTIQRDEIKDHFDYLKGLQISNGTFSNFNLKYMFLINGDDFTERFFSTAYALIPFLKHKDLANTDYRDVIDKAFQYLDKRENRLKVNNYGLSIAAYVYALDGKTTEAENLIEKVKGSFIVRDNKKCFKVEGSDASCSVLMTVYNAMALLKMNKTAEVEPVINWLINSNLKFSYFHDTFYNAIVSEPIVEMGIAKKAVDLTNLKVNLRNEHGYEKMIEITKETAQKPQNVDLPKYSTEITATVSGYGYCTVTMFLETIMMTDKINPKFTLNVNTYSIWHEKLVRVCARYDSKGSLETSIVNVIYEVNFPSGYVYSGIVNQDNKPEIKQVTKSRKDTLAFVYFNDFKENIDYCVDLIARKIFDVKEIKASGVKVYNYNDKENIAVTFYKLQSNNCE